NLVINRLDSNLKNDLLAQGTELMIGDNLRGLDTWKKDKDLNKKPLSQFATVEDMPLENSFYNMQRNPHQKYSRNYLSNALCSDAVDGNPSLNSKSLKLTSLSSRKSFGSNSASSAISSSKKPTGMSKSKTSSQNSESEGSFDLFDEALKIFKNHKLKK
ncbi:hypothetical protein H312_01887, partial [Anncaliia algerae PRA339]